MLDKLRMEQAGIPTFNSKVLRGGLESGKGGEDDQVYSAEIVSLKVSSL